MQSAQLVRSQFWVTRAACAGVAERHIRLATVKHSLRQNLKEDDHGYEQSDFSFLIDNVHSPFATKTHTSWHHHVLRKLLSSHAGPRDELAWVGFFATRPRSVVLVAECSMCMIFYKIYVTGDIFKVSWCSLFWKRKGFLAPILVQKFFNAVKSLCKNADNFKAVYDN